MLAVSSLYWVQAKTSDEQLHKLSNSYIQLKGDFEYNVQLLDGRDAELAQRDADLAQRDAELSERNAELSQCQKQLQEQMALLEQLQQELAAANEGVDTCLTFYNMQRSQPASCSSVTAYARLFVLCGIQQSLLQQAKAIHSIEHDRRSRTSVHLSWRRCRM